MPRNFGAVTYFLFIALVPGHLLGWLVEWGVAVGTALAGMLFYGRFAGRNPAGAKVGLIALALLMLMSCVAFAATLTIETSASGLRDHFDVLRPVLVYFSCVLGLAFSPAPVRHLRIACRLILSYSLACALVLILHIPGLEDIVRLVYGSTKTIISGFFIRLSIPFENPNFLGLFAVLSLCLSFFSGRGVDWLLAVLALLVAALTGSRTAWVTSAVVVLSFALISARDHFLQIRAPGIKGVLVVALLAVGAHYYWPVIVKENQRVIDFIELARAGDLAADASYMDRVRVRAEALDLIAERPFFGVGAMKYSPIGIVDNQYLSLLVRFGIVGSVVLALLFTAAIICGVIRTHKQGLASGFLASCLIVMLWGWTGSFFDNVRLATLTVLCFSVIGMRDGRQSS